MLECVVNVSEGRRGDVIDELAAACGRALLDVHTDADHHRSVYTLAPDAEAAARALTAAAAERVDLSAHEGVHPRLGAIDVVPFVALAGSERDDAVTAARSYAGWVGDTMRVPAFLYGDADPEARSLPDVRRDAFVRREPDVGPGTPHPRLGAVAVGARPPLVAVN
ncbi:MAG: glutamate formimidoyltransferase, partial [Acidimicrobiia bacterium]